LFFSPQMESIEQHPDLPIQHVMELGQMLCQMAATMKDWAEADRQIRWRLLAQAEEQTRALELLAAQTAAATPIPSPWAGVALQKMTAGDDVQSFLETFETVAEACG